MGSWFKALGINPLLNLILCFPLKKDPNSYETHIFLLVRNHFLIFCTFVESVTHFPLRMQTYHLDLLGVIS